jgi:hypothetical protein
MHGLGKPLHPAPENPAQISPPFLAAQSAVSVCRRSRPGRRPAGRSGRPGNGTPHRGVEGAARRQARGCGQPAHRPARPRPGCRGGERPAGGCGRTAASCAAVARPHRARPAPCHCRRQRTVTGQPGTRSGWGRMALTAAQRGPVRGAQVVPVINARLVPRGHGLNSAGDILATLRCGANFQGDKAMRKHQAPYPAATRGPHPGRHGPTGTPPGRLN